MRLPCCSPVAQRKLARAEAAAYINSGEHGNSKPMGLPQSLARRYGIRIRRIGRHLEPEFPLNERSGDLPILVGTSFEAAVLSPELTGALADSFGKTQIVHAVISL